MKCRLVLMLNLCALAATAQQADTALIDYSQFGDADETAVRRYCTQKVSYQAPTKLISLGWEHQGPMDLKLSERRSFVYPGGSGPREDGSLSYFSGLRLAYNTPVISRSNLIVNLGLTYWGSAARVDPLYQGGYSHLMEWSHPVLQELHRSGLRTAGFNTTVFKPLDERRFLILQGNLDLSGNYRSLQEVSAQGLTWSATAVYGWKPNDRLMWGLGASRTYRLGQLIYVPVLYYYKTFNRHWGVEAVLPARAHLRYNINKNGLLMAGYELEGNQYHIRSDNGMANDLFLRRGEIKPRLIYEQSVKNFFWISVQAGLRVNGRFDFASRRDAPDGDYAVETTRMPPAPYGQISINLVSP